MSFNSIKSKRGGKLRCYNKFKFYVIFTFKITDCFINCFFNGFKLFRDIIFLNVFNYKITSNILKCFFMFHNRWFIKQVW